MVGRGDAYEDDDVYTDANPITSGVPQDHNIVPSDDEDFVTFTLSVESAVSLSTSGPGGDTRLYLYDDSGTNEIDFDDDDGGGGWSLIDRTCGVDALPAGTYYAMVDGFGSEIPEYQLNYSAVVCITYDEFIFLPVILRTGTSAAPPARGEPEVSAIWKDLALTHDHAHHPIIHERVIAKEPGAHPGAWFFNPRPRGNCLPSIFTI